MDAVSNLLAKKGIVFVRIDGNTKTESRSEIVQCFQNNSNIRCAILSIRACSAGITLTAANTIIFAELDWTPSNILQAEARAHRIGQENLVKIFFLIAPGTSDDIMWNMLKEKQRNLGGIGLVAANENFSNNTTTTNFEAGPSTMTETPKKNLITNYLTPKASTSPESPDKYFSCEPVEDDDEKILNQIQEVEKNYQIESDDDKIFNQIEEMEKKCQIESDDDEILNQIVIDAERKQLANNSENEPPENIRFYLEGIDSDDDLSSAK